MDLMATGRAVLGFADNQFLELEAIRARLSLATCPDRHDPLADALDLGQFSHLFRAMWKGERCGNR